MNKYKRRVCYKEGIEAPHSFKSNNLNSERNQLSLLHAMKDMEDNVGHRPLQSPESI